MLVYRIGTPGADQHLEDMGRLVRIETGQGEADMHEGIFAQLRVRLRRGCSIIPLLLPRQQAVAGAADASRPLLPANSIAARFGYPPRLFRESGLRLPESREFPRVPRCPARPFRSSLPQGPFFGFRLAYPLSHTAKHPLPTLYPGSTGSWVHRCVFGPTTGTDIGQSRRTCCQITWRLPGRFTHAPAPGAAQTELLQRR